MSFRDLNTFRILFRIMSRDIDKRDWDGVKEVERLGYVPHYYLTEEEIKKRYL